MVFTGPITARITVNDDGLHTVTGNSGVWNCFIQTSVDEHEFGYDAQATNMCGFSVCHFGSKVAICSTEPITANRIVPNVKFEVKTTLGLTGVTVTLIPELDLDQSYDIAIIPSQIYELWTDISCK